MSMYLQQYVPVPVRRSKMAVMYMYHTQLGRYPTFTDSASGTQSCAPSNAPAGAPCCSTRTLGIACTSSAAPWAHPGRNRGNRNDVPTFALPVQSFLRL